MNVQNLAVQRCQWLSCLSVLLCYLRDGENNLPSTPFKIYTEFNKKCACTNETAVRNLCNVRLGLGVLRKRLSLNCFSRRFVMKPIGIGGSRIFLGGGLNDEFIRMCTDCIAVKTQLLR